MATNNTASSSDAMYSKIGAGTTTNTSTDTSIDVTTGATKPTEKQVKQEFVGTDIAKKIGLTEADAQEYNTTGSYGIDAQAKIDAYKKQREIDSRTTKETAQDIVTGTQEAGVELDKQTEQAKLDNEANLKESTALAEKQARETARLLKEQERANAKRDADAKARVELEKKEAIDLLNKKQILAEEDARAEKEKLAREADYQRIQNQNAIIEANKNIEIQRQQSAWAYQKLGLGFSSGIINQSQQIATDGIAKIAEIKAKMNYQERLTGIEESKINTKLKEIDLQYTGLINETISSYSDKLDDLDSNTEKRIQELTKNLLLTNQQKDNKINEVLKSYRSEKTNLERQHIDDMFKIQDRGFQYQKEVEARVEKQKQEKLANLSDEILNGNIVNMSPIEIANMEQSLGLPTGTIIQRTKSRISAGINNIVGSVLGSDYLLSSDDLRDLQNKINNQMKMGKTLEEATVLVTNDYVKGTSRYKQIQTYNNTKYTPKTSSGGTTSSYPEGAVGDLIITAGQLGDNLSVRTAKEILKGGDTSITTYIDGLKEKNKTEKGNKEIQSAIDNKKEKVKLFFDDAKKKYEEDYMNKDNARGYYNALLDAGLTPQEALSKMTEADEELIVVDNKLVEDDLFFDDEVLDTNTYGPPKN